MRFPGSGNTDTGFFHALGIAPWSALMTIHTRQE